MRKFHFKGLSLAAISLFILLTPSCKKDEPFVKPKLAIANSTVTVNEADETMTVEVTIDKAFTEDIIVEYTLDGTATDKVNAGGGPYDYEITSEYLEFEIAKGETTGTIEIALYSDFFVEDPETIEIELESVDNENIEITSEDDIEVTIEQEDGLLVVLEWGVGVGEAYTDVDMDLFLWAELNATLTLTNVSASRASFTSPEFFFLPTAILEDGTYGLSCNYYEGSEDPMNFKLSFLEIISNAVASTTEISASYSAANLNKWDISDIDPMLVQTFEKSGADFNTFSQVTIPVSGSRTGASTLPQGVVRMPADGKIPAILRRLLK